MCLFGFFGRLGCAIVMSIVDAVLKQVAILLHLQELIVGKKYIILSMHFSLSRQSSSARHGPHVHILPDVLLQIVVNRSLLKTLIQINTQLVRQQEEFTLTLLEKLEWKNLIIFFFNSDQTRRKRNQPCYCSCCWTRWTRWCCCWDAVSCSTIWPCAEWLSDTIWRVAWAMRPRRRV